MKVSELRERITIKKPPVASSAVVDLDAFYIPVATMWAKVEYLQGKELHTAMANNIHLPVKFTIRHRKDITADMRVDYNGNEYNITSVQPLDAKHEWLLILGLEVTNSGV